MNILPLHIRVQIAAALSDGVSMRTAERLTGVTRKTIGALLLKLGEGCDLVHDAWMRGLLCDSLQGDEIWAYVGTKQGHLTDTDPEEFGDQYTFVALDHTSRAVISYLTDKRTASATHAFAYDLRARVVGKPQITTDGFKAYIDAIESAFGTRVHYGQSIKHFEDEAIPEPQRRYSPGRLVSVEKRTIFGAPDLDRMTTSHCERGNLTIRMNVRRLTRLTNAWSKRLVFLRAAMSLHFAVYNFVRVHSTLRVTPAMQLGVTDRIWSMEELVAAALDALDDAPPPVGPVGGNLAPVRAAPRETHPAAARASRRRSTTPASSASGAVNDGALKLPAPPSATAQDEDYRWMW